VNIKRTPQTGVAIDDGMSFFLLFFVVPFIKPKTKFRQQQTKKEKRKEDQKFCDETVAFLF
jgi:hypothetical protein